MVKGVDTKGAKTLTELIDNNLVILSKKIFKENIKNFLELIKKDIDKKYVNLLRALCTCNGQPVFFN